MNRSQRRLAIVTQDPANYGGVLRLVEYLYCRAETAGLEPTLLHYARYSEHAELHVSLANLLRGELNLIPKTKSYSFRGMAALSTMPASSTAQSSHKMRATAIGAVFSEWEPNRLRANKEWRNALAGFDEFILVTGSAHTGLPLVECGKKYTVWVSSTVEHDRHSRLGEGATLANAVERMGLPSVMRAEQRVLQGASRVLAVSEDAKKHIAAIAGKDVEVWPYPVDTSRFHPTEGARPGGRAPRECAPRGISQFLFVGRANDPRKRVNLFLEACEELQRIQPELEFEGTIVSTLLDVRKNPGFTLRHVARASQIELIELYRNATALVVTSEQEGLGIAAMEAMACGLPVISTRCGGPETFLEDARNGFLVEDTPQAIARRMSELASNDSLCQELGNSARERIETGFSERVWNSRFEKLLETL
ncbi:MAG TPA: glycosyltransferase family 4 protein [Candidatus Kapabacteria bacterium]|nr:glycosyltransferase family 4 protein [Candidatus Kapabacteria bacterium]